MFKSFVQKRLENYVRQYFKKHPEVKLIAVAGSVGKTSTKVAIATVLAEKYRVRLQKSNHNTFLSAPPAILGVTYPENIKSIKNWLDVFAAMRARIKQPTDVDVIVQELGSDRIGQVEHFATYLTPDIGVVTAVSPEHMEFFHTIDIVAREELALANYSRVALINKDDIDGKFSEFLTNANINTYGTSASAEYHFLSSSYTVQEGHKGVLVAPEWTDQEIPAEIHVFGEHTLRPAIAAAAVGAKMGMTSDEVVAGLAKVTALPGRMNILKGANNSIIIDDTYNSSPLAVGSSLTELYKLSAPQRIAVLGSMNELGQSSAPEHKAIGELCDPDKLAWVVVVGDEAVKYLAPAAKTRGCQVKICNNALDAGAFVRSVLDDNAVVLFKGSQGDIFLEEAVKIILQNSDDEQQLVRQSPQWMEIKNKFFSKF